MLSDNHIEQLVHFYRLDKNERINFLSSYLSKLDFDVQLQKFESPFGSGINILSDSLDNTNNKILLTAHYDGHSLFDNCGGVCALLQIANFIKDMKITRNEYVIAFTDQEERYQQGSYYLLRNNNNYTIKCNINIDGFGIGEKIYNTNIVQFDKSSIFFLTDSELFKSHKIKSISFFSAFASEIQRLRYDDIGYIFKEYNNENFFINKYSQENYSKTLNLLWEQIC